MGWTHLEDKRIKARKAHRCYLCGESIDAGETYVRRSGVNDGSIGAIAMHCECERETKSWDDGAWEEFFEGDMPRPEKGATA